MDEKKLDCIHDNAALINEYNKLIIKLNDQSQELERLKKCAREARDIIRMEQFSVSASDWLQKYSDLTEEKGG